MKRQSPPEYIYGWHPITTLLNLQPQKLKEIFIQNNRHDQKVQGTIALAKKNNITCSLVSKQKLDESLPNSNHQGIAATITNSLYQEQDLPDLLAKPAGHSLVLILDGIQDPHNLGACLRTANAAGVTAVIAPKDNSVGLTSTVHKTACGAAAITPFIQVTNLARTMKLLKELGFWVYGTDAEAPESIYQTTFQGAVAIVLGAEETGLRRLTKENCDYLISIPMYGSIPSLNVSVATGICLFEIAHQLQNHK